MKVAGLLSLLLLSAGGALWAEESVPAFPVPARPLGFDLATPLPPVVITGLDVIAPDGNRLAPPLRLREDGTYTLRIFAKYAENADGVPLTLSAVLDSGGPVREASLPLPGAAKDTPVRVLELPLRLEPAQGAGESVLRIAVARVGGVPPGGILAWPLAVLPAFVAPVPARCALDARRVAELFGTEAVLLDARFRLGKGASMEVSIPPTLSSVSFRAVGIVSYVAWLPRQDRNKSGLVLATVTVSASSGDETFPLRLGLETLPVDGQAFEKNGDVETDRVKIFSEWTQGGAEKARIRRNYAATCPLKALQTVKSVMVSHTGDAAVVQVDGLLLLP